MIGGGVAGLSTARALVELGVTDVVVLERAAVGSGGTGKSSGVVRCHYGIRSLAAMAWHALPVLESATEILGAPSGYTNTGYLVGVGPENLGSLRANVAMQQSLGIEVELVGHDEARRLWPAARLDDFAEFAYEPRGGYGDGHQTALAFATAARRGGARVRQECGVAGIEHVGDKVSGVRLADGDRIGAAHVVVAAGPWSPALAGAARARPARARPARADPRRRPGPAAGRCSLSSRTWCRSSTCAPRAPAPCCSATATTRGPSGPTPTTTASGPDEDELAALVPKFTHRFPGFDGAALSSSYAGCYDVTPDYNPIISATPGRGAVAVHRLLGARLQDLARGRRARGGPDRARARAATPTSTTATSAGRASAKRTPWSASTPTRAPARCVEP